MKKKNFVYIHYSGPFELIDAIADTPGELAKMTGMTKGSILSLISKHRGNVERVELLSDEEEEDEIFGTA